jgi:hypothetical protein
MMQSQLKEARRLLEAAEKKGTQHTQKVWWVFEAAKKRDYG